MKYITINFVLLLLYFISTINQIQCTCVLESDFGFSFNCNFKKAGLFRVRNLGGVKAHFGLGFSVGDELGFPESLGNVEGSKRRALNLRTGANSLGVLPAAKMPSVPSTPKIQQNRPRAVVSPQQLAQMQTSRPRPVMSTPQGFRKPQMTQATFTPLGVPSFKPIPHETIKVSGTSTRLMPTAAGYSSQQFGPNQLYSGQLPSFSSPNANSRISLGPVYQTGNEVASKPVAQFDQTLEGEELPEVDLKGHSVEELAKVANVTVEVIQEAIKMRQQQMLLERRNYASQLKQQISKHITVQTTQATTTTVRTTQPTTTTQRSTPSYSPRRSVSKYSIRGGHKVMNAPKEYYPVGYDKNFDDNFKSKVDLPDTTFHCGDQKHFPGLYADEDLGCMVFHVCALTDDGLIMKSFLCPENTLFDQTVLKCNWWFYTDCKASKSLYDSNLPVSKSYQLMKSLAFFNANYKKPGNGTLDAIDNGIDVEALRNSVAGGNN